MSTYFSNLHNNSSLQTTMKYEAARLSSYAQWRAYDRANPITLAKAGLFYTGNDDVVKCFSCNFLKGNWNRYIIPMVIHREFYPNCRFFCGGEDVNVPIYVPEPMIYREIIETLHQQYCGEERPAFFGTNLLHIAEQAHDSRSTTTQSYTETQTPNNIQHRAHFPVVATDAGAAETSSQAIGVRGALVLSRTSEAAPRREEFAPMKQESIRFASFDGSWPREDTPDPRDLAQAGFFYTGTSDRVQCVFCRGILRNWEEDDVPMEEHRRHFPRCPFVTGLEVGNIPDPTAIIAESRTSHTVNIPETSAIMSDDTLGINTQRPKHSQYAVEASRIASFRNWPRGKTQTPEMLAKAGFFYAGFGDSVKCFYCDGGLRTWEPEDNPWMEHARWFPRCQYVRQVKGEEFIKSFEEISAKGANDDGSENDVMESVLGDLDEESVKLLEENKQLKDERLCKICLDAEVSVVFLPCGHLVSCVTCAPALRKCPICRTDVKGTVRTFMS